MTQLQVKRSKKNLKINEKLQSYIHFTSKVRDFVRERAELEKDYSKRLESLVKKHSGKIRKEGDSDRISTKQAWENIVNETTEHAKLHSQLSDILTQSIAEKLKLLAVRKEESRKKHVSFITQFESERERLLAQLEKCRLDYEASCDLVEIAKGKYERAAEDKSKDKLKRVWHQGILDMNNLKNTYLLALHCVNQMHSRNVDKEIPEMLQQFEEFGIDHHKSILGIFQNYLYCQRDLLKSHLDIVENCGFVVQNVDPTSGTIIKTDKERFSSEPIEYQPCGLWKDDSDLVTDEYSVVYLGNFVAKLHQNQKKIQSQISTKSLGLEGLEKLWESYIKNPLQGDAEMVRETIVEEKRSILLLQMKLFEAQCKIDMVTLKVGQVNTGTCQHHFKPAYFAIPTSCDYCQQTIWGLSSANKGFSCKECGYNAHVKCEMKIPPLCTGVKKLTDKKSRSVSDPTKKPVVVKREAPKIPLEEKRSASIPATSVPDPNIAGTNTVQSTSVSENRISSTLTVDSSTQIPEIPTAVTTADSQSETNSKEPQIPTLERRKTFGRSTLSLSHFKFREGLKATVLYDYNATDEEEATIKEGDKITVISPDDGTGWTLITSASGEIGLVPSTYLMPLQESHSSETLKHPERMGVKNTNKTVIYAYTKSSADELSVRAGQLVEILEEDDGSGWIMAQAESQKGLIPASYVIHP